MATFEKAFWSIDGNNIAMNMPIQKVDQERRIVSGWATTDLVDKQGDIIEIDASERAFERFRGNVREQHTSLAVGKVVSFKKETYFDKDSGEFHNGIFVDVYVSKGAQDTWHKVTEGVLSGFSIGGAIKDYEDSYNKSADAPVRIIKDYDLYELSLVDNPANPASNIVSIQKMNADEVVEKNYLENVYWCEASETIIVSDSNDYDCPQCDKKMTNIGFVESTDAEKAQTVQNLVNSFIKGNEISDINDSESKAIDGIAKSIANNNEKEGNIMGILNRKTTVVEEYVAKSDEPVAETVEVVEEVIEKSADEAVVEPVVEEAAAEEVAADAEVDQSTDAAADEEETVEKSTAPADSNEDLAKTVNDINAFVADAVSELVATVKSLADQIADLKKSTESVTTEVASVKEDVQKFGERVDSVEADTAVRKSGELGGFVQEERVQKSMWGGRFLNSADLYR